jgi:phosphoribosyl-ATP pyrophosphohydrolase/phosphoribosyl-AMP cyclohydrolase
MDLSGLRWDAAGLLTVVVQERGSGEVRMVAHANGEALERTVSEGVAWFFSRSRNALWKKGETSGNVIEVSEVWVDCDGDAVIYLGEARGPSCHTGERTCFFRDLRAAEKGGRAAPVLVRLWDALEARREAASGEKSYTKSLLEAGALKIGDKVREEADELARALASESPERVVSEAADVLYHAMVGLLARGVTLADVERELARRFGVSGHDEKASRSG